METFEVLSYCQDDINLLKDEWGQKVNQFPYNKFYPFHGIKANT